MRLFIDTPLFRVTMNDGSSTIANAARGWMEARAEDLLPVEYLHVVFTLPAANAQVSFWNKKAVYSLLFRASAEAVMTIAADPRRLAARIGLTSVLHIGGSAPCWKHASGVTLSRPHPHPHDCAPSRQICVANRLPGNGWLPSHPALRPAGQRNAEGQHRPHPRPARAAFPRTGSTPNPLSPHLSLCAKHALAVVAPCA